MNVFLVLRTIFFLLKGSKNVIVFFAGSNKMHFMTR